MNQTSSPGCPVVQGSPFGAEGPRVLLWDPRFAADPHAAYQKMRRRFGPVVPVELAEGVPAMLVIGYRLAVKILHDAEHFPADPRVWQDTIPECPVRQVLQYRRSAFRTAGKEHERYRDATGLLRMVELNRLHRAVDEAADICINAVRAAGAVDLRNDYALPVVGRVLADLMGMPDELAARAYQGITAVMDGASTAEAAAGEQMYGAALAEAVRYRKTYPGDDLISQLIAHPARFDDEELSLQSLLTFSAGMEPTANLVLNTLRLMLTTDSGKGFAGGLLGGSLSTRDALAEVLYLEPPLANFHIAYPPQPILLDGVWFPAHQPVVIGHAACNNDPAIAAADRTGNRAHLSYGAGPHACPATGMAEVIAMRILEQIIDAFPDMELAVPVDELRWRPGIFHRALESLPVRFPPVHQQMVMTAPLLLEPVSQYL